MEHKYIVNVTQSNIDDGDQESIDQCPVALAVNEAMGYNPKKVLRVKVYEDATDKLLYIDAYARVDVEKNHKLCHDQCTRTGFHELNLFRAWPSNEVYDFVKAFDAEETVEPFSFETNFKRP